MNLLQLLVGLLLSVMFSFLAYRVRALSLSGVAGAVVVGTAVFGLGGWVWALLLIAFFVTSSALSRYREGEKVRLAEKFAKTGQRDLGQALANGGWGALLAVANVAWPSPPLFAGFVGAMAAVTADTWATEVGVLSRQPPRLITTGRPVPVGTSGGVSALGITATALGGLSMGVLAAVFSLVDAMVRGGPPVVAPAVLVVVAGAAGLSGSLLDSLLGATLQGIYFCDACHKETERPVHGCGNPARHLRGWSWLNNDVVNSLASIFGSVVGLLLSAALVT